jgi:two-component system, LuxR family, response regulator FixJ
MSSGPASVTVHIVDGDSGFRESLVAVLRSSEFDACGHPSADAFLKACGPDPAGCLIADVRLPDISGLELQRELLRLGYLLPVIFLTEHSDVDSMSRAFRAGAVDYLQKPYLAPELVRLIRAALHRDDARRRMLAEHAADRFRLAKLSRREREVADLIASGLTTKAIAKRLGSSFHTVQNQRAVILRKLEAKSVIDLVRIIVRSNTFSEALTYLPIGSS